MDRNGQRLESFGREPAFEGAEIRSVRRAVGNVVKALVGVIQVITLILTVGLIAVLGCIAADASGTSSDFGLTPLFDLGRWLMRPCPTMFPAGPLAHGQLDWDGVVVMAIIAVIQLGLQWSMRRLRRNEV